MASNCADWLEEQKEEREGEEEEEEVDIQHEGRHDDLYAVLGVEKTATQREIKLAFYRQAKLHHPDKQQQQQQQQQQQEIAEDRTQFQAVVRAYEVLSDETRKKLYDQTGGIDDSAHGLSGDMDWAAYWRALYQKIEQSDIDEFMAKYHGSREEREDIAIAFDKCGGDLVAMVDFVPLCESQEDIIRMHDTVRELVELSAAPTRAVSVGKKRKTAVVTATSKREDRTGSGKKKDLGSASASTATLPFDDNPLAINPSAEELATLESSAALLLSKDFLKKFRKVPAKRIIEGSRRAKSVGARGATRADEIDLTALIQGKQRQRNALFAGVNLPPDPLADDAAFARTQAAMLARSQSGDGKESKPQKRSNADKRRKR